MKILKVLLTLGVIMFIFSCSEDDQLKPASDVKIEKRQRLLDHFAFWGDNLCNDDHIITINFTANNCFDGHIYEDAFVDAVNLINGLGLNIELELVSEFDPNADIRVICSSDPDICEGGWAGVLISGQAVLMALNTAAYYSNCPGCEDQDFPDLCQATFIAAHELLHALGLDHTNASSGTHITGTPLVDNESIVNDGSSYPDWCDLDCELSSGDIAALEQLYGCPIEPELILGPNIICVNQTVEYCIDYKCFSFVDWSGDGGVNGMTERCVSFSSNTAGVEYIYAEVEIGECTYSLSKRIEIVPQNGECFCVCEAQEQSGKDVQIEEWKIPVDCCDERPCSEIVPLWWDEYLLDRSECFKKVGPCNPPSVNLQGADELCVGHSTEICISGFYNSTAAWSVSSGGSLSYSSSKCRNFTADSPGTYTISVKVCHREDGEGQEDCCVTMTHTIVVKDDCNEECYCRCWVQEQSGDDGPYQEDIPVDCNDTGDCADIIPDWWYEYLTYPVDCEKIII